MKKSFFIFMLFILAFFSGCGHHHIVIAMNVPNTGDKVIKTKYRYRSASLAKYQPEVFDANGIPIVINRKTKAYRRSGGDWTWILSMSLTCGFLPMGQHKHIDNQWSVTVGDGKEFVETTVESCEHLGESFSLLSPLSLLFFWGTGNCFKEAKVFDGHSFATGLEMPQQEQQRVNSESLAYGIAVKLKELEDSGRINEQLVAKAFSFHHLSEESKLQRSAEESRKKRAGEKFPDSKGKYDNPFNIVRLEHEDGVDFAYRFVLASKSSERISLADYNTIRTAFRTSIKEQYLLEHPSLNPRTLIVDFPDFSLKKGQIFGRALILTISVESIEYDVLTRRGKLAIRISVNQFEEARQWIRNNLCDLAMEAKKSAGENFPVGTRFYMGSETLNEDGILMVDFKTE